MRYFLPLAALALTACAGNDAQMTRIDARTFKIESPEIPGGSAAPNRRLAQQLCPNGYRLLNEDAHKGGPDRAIYDQQNITTIWFVRCL
jgi:hypothetical protein